MVPKLKYEHVHLTSFSKMRVDLAAQVYALFQSLLCVYHFCLFKYYNYFLKVLSGTVSKALRVTGGDDASETAKFVEMIDHFFDCLNVGNYTSGKHSRNPFKQPYRSGLDFRLTVSTHFCIHVQILITTFCQTLTAVAGN